MKKQPLAAFFIGRILGEGIDTMKSIKKKSNNLWAIGCFLVLLIIFLILISKTPMQRTKEVVKFEEMLVLIKALNENADADKYESLKEKYVINDGQSDVTYGMLKETLSLAYADDMVEEFLPDKLSQNEFVERKNFFSLYEQIIKTLGKEKEIFLEEVGILGVSSVKDKNVVITSEGVGVGETTLFEQYKGFLTKCYVKHSQKKVEYLLVKETLDKSINLPYMYVTGLDGEGVHFWVDGIEVILPCKDNLNITNDIIITLTIKNGQITDSKIQDKKINDKVLAVNENAVTLEKLGMFEFSEEMKVYKVFDGLKEGSISDVALGYEFVDFVLDGEKICACLIVASDKMEYIRVLIKTDDFESHYHNEVSLTSDSSYKVYVNGENIGEYSAGEEISFSLDEMKTDEIVKIVPDVLSGKVTVTNLSRNQGVPKYGGIMEIHKKDEGLVLINELLLEEYLYTVVPSEMPAYYEKEALMAQAVCARTYAYTKMQDAGLKELGAHLDDSVSFQVYNNIQEQISTTSAVRQTVGQILMAEGKPIETMYYSTSWGVGSGGLQICKENNPVKELSTNEEFEKYITIKNEMDFEADEGFYRWEYETKLDVEVLEKRLKECYNKNKEHILFLESDGTFKVQDKYLPFGNIEEIFVSARSNGGRAESLIIRGNENSIMVCGEYQIRYVLLNPDIKVVKQDGTMASMSTLLPSAFFKIETGKNNGSVIAYSLIGGGYGHGNGMSQNGAANMAEYGYSYADILNTFYENSMIEQLY